jgi:hypothetical protein
VRDGVPIFARYRRNYPQFRACFAEDGAFPPPPIDFDVLTEISFWTRTDHQLFLEQCGQAGIGDALTSDEANLFDRTTIRVVLADEHMTYGKAQRSVMDARA